MATCISLPGINFSIKTSLYIDNFFKFLIKFFLLHINTFTLEPSFTGLTTTGNLNFLSIFVINFLLIEFLLNLYFKNLGVSILFLIYISFERILSMAIEDAKTPECVYFTCKDSNTA